MMKDEMLNGFAHESVADDDAPAIVWALGTAGTAAMAGLMGPEVFGAVKGLG